MPRSRISTLNRYLVWLLAAVFLLPLFGPWVDFHYAEWQPNHQHIYLGKVNLNHHRNADNDDIIILPDQDATSQPVVLFFLPEAQTAVHPHGSESLTFSLSDDFHAPEDAFLPPPDHPPRL